MGYTVGYTCLIGQLYGKMDLSMFAALSCMEEGQDISVSRHHPSVGKETVQKASLESDDVITNGEDRSISLKQVASEL